MQYIGTVLSELDCEVGLKSLKELSLSDGFLHQGGRFQEHINVWQAH